MKVLISAYACEPGAGSEPGAGWAWSRAAALDHDVWVITRSNNVGPIEAALAAEPELRYTPVYLDLPPWARFWKKWPMGVQVYYLLWQVLAWRAARRLHREVVFDVAHHLTFAVDWMPAGVAFVPGLPFVWGPVGGAVPPPAIGLLQWLGVRGTLSEAFREVVTRTLRRGFGDPTSGRASIVLAQNDDVADRFRRACAVIKEPNVAIGSLGPRPVRRNQRADLQRAVFVGRLVPWKGLCLAVATLADSAADGWVLDVYGDGPDRRRGERLAAALGVEKRVTFHGLRPRDEVVAALANAAALVLPSMHDSASWAVAESIGVGCPVVCLDRGGPPALIGRARGGSAVPMSGSVVASLAAALDSARNVDMDKTAFSVDRLPALLREVYTSAARSRGSVTKCT